MFNVFDGWRERRSIRRTRQHLSQLSDQMLTDIGLIRADIDSMGAHCFGRRSDARRGN
ncbi:DUF1127 domain-containing protein [Devosia sp.]|uniref:DUF1127 domain-containing protein n=1 Tax=Devosia sp. TaxID=1871048 RepID=UPI002FC58470